VSLTKEERALLLQLAEARNAFVRLPRCHPRELEEFTSAMHRLQDLVMMRSAVRSHPYDFVREQGFE